MRIRTEAVYSHDRKNPVAALGHATFLEREGTTKKAGVAYEDIIGAFKGTKEAGVAELRLRALPRSPSQ